MSEYSRRITAGIVIVVIITAFVAIELDNLYAPSSTRSSTTIETKSISSNYTSISSNSKVTSSNYTTAISSGVSPAGLQLKMTLNSSTIASHGTIFVQIELVNTLNQNISVGPMPGFNQTVGALNLDMESVNNYDFTCGQNPTQFLVDFTLLKGHYSADNISSAGTPLTLSAPIFPPCPGFYDGQSAVIFLPDGDQAVATYPYPISSARITSSLNATTFYCAPKAGLQAPGNCGAGQGLVGYWNATADAQGDLNFTSPAFTYFPPGEYTIVAFDAWNQYSYATFTVTG
jgi:hypothetical protein